MANSLEVRPVLLDHKLLEVAFSLPDDYKMQGFVKSVFIDSVRDLLPSHIFQEKRLVSRCPLLSG